MADLTSPFAAALTLLWAPTGLIIAAYLGLLQFKVGCQSTTSSARDVVLLSASISVHADDIDCCSQTFYALFATLAARRRGGMLWRKVQPCEPFAAASSWMSPPGCRAFSTLGAHSPLPDFPLCLQPWPDSAPALRTLSGAFIPISSSTRR